MAWIELVESPFTIITADGLSYTVNWKNATVAVNYFIAEFTFPGLNGSKVDRGMPKGSVYDIEFYFQGDDNISQAKDFRKSADVQGSWTLLHPIYGQLLVQPIGLMYDNSQMGSTKVTGQVIETIAMQNPVTKVNPVDNILLSKANTDAAFINSITTTPSGTDIQTLQKNNNYLYKTTIPILQIPADVQNFFNLFSIAQANINNALASPQIAMSAVQSVINAPALIETNTQIRVQTLSMQFQSLRTQIQPKNSYQKVPASTKQLYAVNGAAAVGALAVAASTPLQGNYTNMTDVLNIITIIINNYNQYILDLDSIQTPTGAELDSYIPDYNSLILLRDLISFVISNLFNVALSAKQERKLLLDRDTNLIVLTHMIYGLDEFDNNMNELMANNQWGISQMIQIKKNTQVVYYI
jgi:hypothetical protein